MGVELLAHIGIPFATGLVLLLFIAASDKEPLSWASCNDIGLDLCILSVGACGGIFANPTLIKNLGDRAAVYGILVVLGDLLSAGLLIYLRRWQRSEPTVGKAALDISLGLLTIVWTANMLRFA